MSEKIFTGCIDDNRPQIEKQRDWESQEVALALPEVEWKEKTTFRTFPLKRQDGSGSCVAQTISKLLGINNFLESGIYAELSAKYLYCHRSNSTPGMTADDALNLGVKLGCPPEQLCPSQNQNEAEMNQCLKKPFITDSAKVFSAKSYLRLTQDIDEVSKFINSGLGVMLWVKFFGDEWNEAPEIKHDVPIEDVPNCHSIAGVDFSLYKNEKAGIIDDSWGQEYGINGQRILRETFLKKRLILAACFFDMPNGSQVGKAPVFYGGRAKYGDKNDIVYNIQDCLRWLGFFKGVNPTGYYGGMTAKAIYDFQVANAVDTKEELDKLLGMSFGAKSEKKMFDILGY